MSATEQTTDSGIGKAIADRAIWFFAFGYFASYVPYSSLAKAISSGSFAKMDAPASGFLLLPVSVSASFLGMLVFLTAMKWWRFAGHRQILGRSLPCPSRYTLFSGLCTAAIIGTTTLAYTFEGISIVFMMLLMRGGVLALAPIVDRLSRRKVHWYSLLALGLSLAALLVAFYERRSAGTALSTIAVIDVSIYLASYFVRLRFMSRFAKSDDSNARTRYFVEEQMVATPAILLMLIVLALIGAGEIGEQVRAGFTQIPQSNIFFEIILIGIFSQGTGVFGGLILLDKRENTFSVPVNRCSSILAGVVATLALHFTLDKRLPSQGEYIGVVLILLAITALSIPQLTKKRA